jgi:hypothetical protein
LEDTETYSEKGDNDRQDRREGTKARESAHASTYCSSHLKAITTEPSRSFHANPGRLQSGAICHRPGPQCVALNPHNHSEWLSRHHGWILRDTRGEDDRRVVALIRARVSRERQEEEAHLFLGSAIGRLWSRCETHDEHHRVVPPREYQKSWLHISRVTAVVWPTVDDHLDRFPRSLERLAERWRECAHNQGEWRDERFQKSSGWKGPSAKPYASVLNEALR